MEAGHQYLDRRQVHTDAKLPKVLAERADTHIPRTKPMALMSDLALVIPFAKEYSILLGGFSTVSGTLQLPPVRTMVVTTNSKIDEIWRVRTRGYKSKRKTSSSSTQASPVTLVEQRKGNNPGIHLETHDS